VGAANSALNVLMVLMLDQKSPAAVRLRAAISVLEQLVKLRELNNLEQRIARLEEFYGD
jgi:thioredoxin-like negative regulator of GroEL